MRNDAGQWVSDADGIVPTEASLKPFVRSRSLATKPIAASQGQCPLCANRDIMQGDNNKIFSLNLNP